LRKLTTTKRSPKSANTAWKTDAGGGDDRSSNRVCSLTGAASLGSC
jgi:hypothetical protein